MAELHTGEVKDPNGYVLVFSEMESGLVFRVDFSHKRRDR